jgi:hypothetical protein
VPLLHGGPEALGNPFCPDLHTLKAEDIRFPLRTSPFPLFPYPCYISGLGTTVEIPVLVSFQLLWKNYLRTFIYRKRFILFHGFRDFALWSLAPVAFGSLANLYIMMASKYRRNRLNNGQHSNFFYKVTLKDLIFHVIHLLKVLLYSSNSTTW